MSTTAPDHATKKYRADIHFISFQYEVFSAETAPVSHLRNFILSLSIALGICHQFDARRQRDTL